MLKKWGFRDSAGKIDWLVIFVCMVMTSGTLGEYVRAVFMRIPPLSDNLGYPATYALYAIVLLLALRRILRKLKIVHFLFPIAILLYYLLSYNLHHFSQVYLDEYASHFFLLVLPMYFIGMTWNADRYIKPLHIVSLMALAMSMVHVFLFGGQEMVVSSKNMDQMSEAYGVLMPLCLITYFAFLEKRKLDVIASLVGFVFLVSLGTRGPIVCYFFFITLCLGIVLKKKGVLMFVALMIPLACLAATDSIQRMLIAAMSQLERVGMSTRILHKFLEGEFLQSSGRNTIQDTLLNAIHNHDFVGLGFLADRTFLEGGYAHNIVLELWVDFGRVSGSVLFVIILLLIARALMHARNQNASLFVVLFVSCALGHLMFSGSYLTSGNFFLLLGLICSPYLKLTDNNSALPQRSLGRIG